MKKPMPPETKHIPVPGALSTLNAPSSELAKKLMAYWAASVSNQCPPSPNTKAASGQSYLVVNTAVDAGVGAGKTALETGDIQSAYQEALKQLYASIPQAYLDTLEKNGGSKNAVELIIHLHEFKRVRLDPLLPTHFYGVVAKATLNEEGALRITSFQPQIPKIYLSMPASTSQAGAAAPTNSGQTRDQGFAVGCVEDMDVFIGANPWKGKTLEALMDYASAMLSHVSQASHVDFEKPVGSIDPNELQTKSIEAAQTRETVLSSFKNTPSITISLDQPVTTRHLERFYRLAARNFQNRKDISTGLLNTVVAANAAGIDGLKNLAQTSRPNALSPTLAHGFKDRRTGHMGRQFALAPAQRQALNEQLRLENSDVLAVNGPPGTGKTTLLQSVVASQYVQSALELAPYPPLVMACSTNNQAITNIIDSFASADAQLNVLVGQDAGSTPNDAFSKRWIKGLNSHGLYMKESGSVKEEQGAAKDLELQRSSPSLLSQNQTGYFDLNAMSRLEKTPVPQLEAYYIQCFKQAFPSSPASTTQEALKHIERIMATAVDVLKKIESHLEQGKSTRREIESLIPKEVSWREASEHLNHEVRVLQNKQAGLQGLKTQFDVHAGATPFWIKASEWIGFQSKAVVNYHQRFFEQASLDPNSRYTPFFVQNPAVLVDAKSNGTDGAAALFIRETIKQKGKVRQAIEAAFSTALKDTAQGLEHNSALLLHIKRLESALDAHRNGLNEIARKLGLPESERMSESAIDRAADTKIRQPLFRFASYYWEGRWIEEVKANQDAIHSTRWVAPNRDDLRKKLGRYSMITPCLVSTFHSLPKYLFHGGKPKTGEMFGVANELIDLLIVDESGQVSPEIGMIGFALAKKAMVVGDTRQIEPVWSVSPGVDGINVRQSGIFDKQKPLTSAGKTNPLDVHENGSFNGMLKDSNQDTRQPELLRLIENFTACPLSASGGNLMAIAQNAARVHTVPELAAGLHLLEHRRCHDEIIAFCNELTYRGKLIPMKGTAPVAHESALGLPPLGYLHVCGTSNRSAGGSRENTAQAKALAQWVAFHAIGWISSTGKRLEDIVAIVTPFKAQAARISTELVLAFAKEGLGLQIESLYERMGLLEPINTKGIPENRKHLLSADLQRISPASAITVGTVHALQGAERALVLFSPVYDKSDAKNQRLFFDQGPNMLNVAVSRSKDHFIVVGDMDVFDPNLNPGTPSSLLGKHLFSSPAYQLSNPVSKAVPSESRLVNQAKKQVAAGI
jgi:hypothetical protein